MLYQLGQKHSIMYDYRPAKLVKGKDRWYIIFYQTNPNTNQLQRHRETFDLNRITNILERDTKAMQILGQLNGKYLAEGYPYSGSFSMGNKSMRLPEAINYALNIHEPNLRKASFKDYKNKSLMFVEWWKKSDYRSVQINHVNNKHLISYFDYMTIHKKVSGTTYNNHMRTLSAVFQLLVDRDFLEKNPVQGIKKRKASKKIRRPLSKEEQKSIFGAADPQLKLCILLTFALGIRPAEIRRMRRHHVDLENKMINLPSEVTKNKHNSIIFIPESVIEKLAKLMPECSPGMHIVGRKMMPSFEMCGMNTINFRHAAVLRKLQNNKILEHVNGICFYSWKDTGAVEMAKQMNIVALMHHFRHQDISTTQRYVNELSAFSKEIKSLHFALLE